jgi:hypothetical protein
MRPCCGLVDLQQCGEALADFIKQFGGSDANHFDVSLLPGDVTRWRLDRVHRRERRPGGAAKEAVVEKRASRMTPNYSSKNKPGPVWIARKRFNLALLTRPGFRHRLIGE